MTSFEAMESLRIVNDILNMDPGRASREQLMDAMSDAQEEMSKYQRLLITLLKNTRILGEA